MRLRPGLGWDGSQFERCTAAKYAYAIIDLVSRKWITSILSAEATGVQVKVLFLKALEAEGLLSDDLAERLVRLDDAAVDDDIDAVPLLLAISDNGTEMRCRDTRRFMAICSIAQHFGRPATPTDQAWIETLWGHIKYEHPHLLAIDDPAVFAAELERIRVHYNTVRLSQGVRGLLRDVASGHRCSWRCPASPGLLRLWCHRVLIVL